MLRIDKTVHLSFFSKFVSSYVLSIGLCGSVFLQFFYKEDVLLFRHHLEFLYHVIYVTVQGIRAKFLRNLKQIGIKLNLVCLEYRVKTPPEDTLGKRFYG